MQPDICTNVEWAAPERDATRLNRDLQRTMKALKAGRRPAEYLQSVHQRRSRLWWRLARGGISSSRWIVGRCFADGIGVPRNVREAVRWYRWAARRGCVLAQTDLGACYARGDGVEQDCGKAARWYAKAAAQGFGWAQLHLAFCYLQGQGVGQDEFEAASLFREAADQGYAAAQYHLGVCYLKGFGVGRDGAEARRWLRRAAMQGFAPAHFRLAQCPRMGRRPATQPDRWTKVQQSLMQPIAALGRLVAYCIREGI